MNTKLEALRQMMSAASVDVYYFNTTDYHCSEYVSEYFKTIRYFSGFTGSLATLLVDSQKAYIFVDGRYFLQADEECLKNDVEVVKLNTEGALDPVDFISANYQEMAIGLDAKRTSIAFVRQLYKKDVKVIPCDLYSAVMEERAELRKDKIFELPITYTGMSRKDKLARVFKVLNGKCHIVNNLESIAYILNLRSNDVNYTPVFLSYLVFLHNQVFLFVNMERMSEELIRKLEKDGVSVRPYERYYELLSYINDQDVILDENKVNFESYMALNNHDNRYIHMRSIIEEMKAVKNEVEIQNARMAHILDGVSMVKFLYWLAKADKTKLTEYDCAQYLDNIRLDNKAFELSFSTIVGYNENAAKMHYSPTREKSTRLSNSGILLVDSGGQYFEGTTDITRTIALGIVSKKVKRSFTLVLNAMFNFASATFMKGMSGKQLDVLARGPIWNELIDYRCGTGHGVGHVLSVHENPPNIRYMASGNGSEDVEIKPGNIFSDEPGIYIEGEYGIRIENLLLAKVRKVNEYGTFMNFEHLTLCPIDLNLIDETILETKTKEELNRYHEMVYLRLSPYLNAKEDAFLKEITRKI